MEKLQACKHSLRTIFGKLWKFLDKQEFFGSVYPLMATSLQYYSTINLFLFENIQCTGENCNLGNFYMIRKEICDLRTFFNPENLLADKPQLFPCLGVGWCGVGWCSVGCCGVGWGGVGCCGGVCLAWCGGGCDVGWCAGGCLV